VNSLAEGKIEVMCKELRMPGLRQHFRSIAREAREREMGYIPFLAVCLEQEMKNREQRRNQRYLKDARFPWKKTLGDFIFEEAPWLPKMKIIQFAEGEFIRRKEKHNLHREARDREDTHSHSTWIICPCTRIQGEIYLHNAINTGDAIGRERILVTKIS